MSFDPSITAAKVEPQVLQWHNQMNRGRQMPQIPAMFRQLAEERKLFIFNVGPWGHERMMGSLGTFFVKACAPDKKYSDPIVLKGVLWDFYPDGDTFKTLTDEGEKVAQSILGIGPHLSPANSLVPMGVFVSKTNPPSAADLAAANLAFDTKCRELVDEANLAYAQGPVMAEQTIRPEVHFMAARRLNLGDAECPWLKKSQGAADRKACENCGTVYKVGIVQCPACQFVLDVKRYNQYITEGRIPGKPIKVA